VPGPATSTTTGPSISSSSEPSAVPTLDQTAVGSPNPSTKHYLAGPVGFYGATAWILSAGGLSVSQDGGRSWTAVALPDRMPSSSVLAVSAALGRAVWLAAVEGDGIRLYRKAEAAASWSSTPLMPSWPAISGVSGQPIESAILTPGPAGLVTVAETIGTGNFNASTSLFVSTDDGKTFVQHPPPVSNDAAALYWDSVTFVTPSSGVVDLRAGTADPTELLHTSDGGATWLKVSPATISTFDNRYYGKPVIVGSDIEVPMSSWTADGTTTFSLMVSHDGGATFAPLGTPLQVGAYTASSDTLGQVTWVVAGAVSTIYETSDAGQTWTSVTPAGVQYVGDFHLTGPASATAVIGESGCNGFKTDCWSRSYLVATTDGGRTWSNR
jgi:hypothetical protein